MIYQIHHLKEDFPTLGANGCDAYVECYIPDGIQTEPEDLSRKKQPAMIVCPGGGYWYTSDREAEPIGNQFMAEGYRVFVVRYSVKPHTFPQQLLEIAGALEYVYQKAEEWCVDLSKISIIGFSAGGHLAAQYANRYDCPEVRKVFPESKPVNACILGYPVITSDEKYTHEATMRHFVGHTPETPNESGCSCELLVTEKTPPTFLWHTAKDQAVPVENSLIYSMALSAHKVPFELHIYPYGQHGLATVDGYTYAEEPEADVARAKAWIADAKSWLKMTLG